LKYDVAIVGAGPAGIFTALGISRNSDLKVLLVDKGPDIEKRSRDKKEHLISGWGGAGAFSDGKLNFSTETGGWLKDYVGEAELLHYLNEVEKVYLEFGAPRKVFGTDEDAINEIWREAALADLRLIPSRIRHLGSDETSKLLKRVRNELDEKVEIRTECKVEHILVDGGSVSGIELQDGSRIGADYVVVGPGRAGSDWLKKEAERLGLSTGINPIDIGIRVEVPDGVMERLTSVLYEPKFIYYSKAYDDKVRTFCVNPSGFVVPEYLNDIVTVNGHSYRSKKSMNTNFAVLVSTKFTEPFKDPIAYGKYIAKLANLLAGGVMIQRLGDLEIGKRSTRSRIARSIITPTYRDAEPGDLSFVLPARYLIDIKEMLKALDKLAPGVYSKHTLLYGIEVKFYSLKYKLSNRLESEIRNLFLVGDGAGVTRGLVQASSSGLIVADEILRREGKIREPIRVSDQHL